MKREEKIHRVDFILVIALVWCITFFRRFQNTLRLSACRCALSSRLSIDFAFRERNKNNNKKKKSTCFRHLTHSYFSDGAMVILYIGRKAFTFSLFALLIFTFSFSLRYILVFVHWFVTVYARRGCCFSLSLFLFSLCAHTWAICLRLYCCSKPHSFVRSLSYESRSQIIRHVSFFADLCIIERIQRAHFRMWCTLYIFECCWCCSI